jgi:hypothetical protein
MPNGHKGEAAQAGRRCSPTLNDRLTGTEQAIVLIGICKGRGRAPGGVKSETPGLLILEHQGDAALG